MAGHYCDICNRYGSHRRRRDFRRSRRTPEFCGGRAPARTVGGRGYARGRGTGNAARGAASQSYHPRGQPYGGRRPVSGGGAPRGELRITAPILFGRLHVLPIVTEFLGRFAEVSVALSLIDRPVDLVEEGLDVAVRIGAPAESSAVATSVGAVHRIVVASPDYMTQHGTPQVPADLAA